MRRLERRLGSDSFRPVARAVQGIPPNAIDQFDQVAEHFVLPVLLSAITATSFNFSLLSGPGSASSSSSIFSTNFAVITSSR
jgi:hypothetical protein